MCRYKTNLSKNYLKEICHQFCQLEKKVFKRTILKRQSRSCVNQEFIGYNITNQKFIANQKGRQSIRMTEVASIHHSNLQLKKYKYINTNTQIQKYKYKNTNTKTQIQKHKYKNKNTNTNISAIGEQLCHWRSHVHCRPHSGPQAFAFVFMILGLETWFTQEFTKSLTLPTSSNTYSIFNNGIKTKMFNRSFFSLSGWLSPSVWPIPSGKSVRLFENGNQCLRGYLTKTILKMWDCLEFRYLCNNVFHVETLWNFPFQLYCVSLRPVAIS